MNWDRIKDWMVSQRSELAATLLVLALSAILWWMPPLFTSPFAQDVERVRGEVLRVDNAGVQQFGFVRQGDQGVTVRILEGRFKGEVVDANNTLLGKMDLDKLFVEGDTALLVIDEDLDEILAVTAYDHYRLDIQGFVFIAFAIVLVLFAGWTGLRALVSFVFALLLLGKLLIPGILLGWDPLLFSLGLLAVLSLVTMVMVAGANRTALTAMLGSWLGILLTAGISLALFKPFHLNGAMQPYAESLLYAGFPHLNLDKIFLAAVFIGASGAVMDLAIDVAAAMAEIWVKRPDLKFKELFLSGIVVGRAMTSTMITTLLMAYVSGFIALIMLFVAQGISFTQLLNTGLISAELLRTLVGSLGLVTVAPFTALVGGLLLRVGGEKKV